MELWLFVLAVIGALVLGVIVDFVAGRAAAARRRRQQARSQAAQFGMEAQLNRLTQDAIQQLLLQSRLTDGVGDRARRPSPPEGEVIEGEAWDA